MSFRVSKLADFVLLQETGKPMFNKMLIKGKHLFNLALTTDGKAGAIYQA